jgi:endoribonuclease Dicer
MPGIDGEKPNILAAVMVHGHSVAHAEGISGRYAKIRASERALVAIQGLLKSDYRLKYSCDCGPEGVKDLKNMEIGTAV